MPPAQPSDRPPRRTRSPISRPFSPLWFAAAFFGLLLVFNVVNQVVQQGKALEYSQFKSLLAQGQVTEAVLAPEVIRGKYRGPDGNEVEFNTTIVNDPKLIEQLESKGVIFRGERPSRWIAEMLGWVLPIILIIALWMFFFRRIGGTESGIMSFARSRAKIYADDDVKVSFADVAGVEEAADELREIVEFLKNPRKYTTLGGRIPKGVLLVGPP